MANKLKLAMTIALLEALCFFKLVDFLCRKFALKCCEDDTEYEYDDDTYKDKDDNGSDYSCDCCFYAHV